MTLFEKDFVAAKSDDPMFEKATVVLCTPPSSGSAIVDKLTYFLQEEGT